MIDEGYTEQCVFCGEYFTALDGETICPECLEGSGDVGEI